MINKEVFEEHLEGVLSNQNQLKFSSLYFLLSVQSVIWKLLNPLTISSGDSKEFP